MAKTCVLGIMVTNRTENAPMVQKVLTEYGCNIKTRIGLHETNENLCSPAGLILLELFGDEKAQAGIDCSAHRLKPFSSLDDYLPGTEIRMAGIIGQDPSSGEIRIYRR